MKTCTHIMWTDSEPHDCGEPAESTSVMGPRCKDHPYVKPVGLRFEKQTKGEE